MRKKILKFICLGFVFSLAFILPGCKKHQHSFEDYKHDEEHHWQVCSVCSQFGGYGEHDFEIEVTAQPNCQAEGLQTKTCKVCGYSVTEDIQKLDHTLVQHPAKPATCTEEGYIEHYECSECHHLFITPGGLEVILDDVKVEKTAHSLGKVNFTWSNDYSTCTATQKCINCDYSVQEVKQSVSDVKEEATCSSEGLIAYTVNFDNYGEVSTVVKTPVKGHTFTAPVYKWNGNEECIATRTCSACTTVETEKAVVTKEVIKDANCTITGQVKYVATFTNPAFENQEKVVDVECTPHEFGAISYIWNEDHSECKATQECAKCHAVNNENATITSVVTKKPTCTEKGTAVFYAIFENPNYKTQTVEVEIEETGHAYGIATYAWAEDYSICEASRICSNCLAVEKENAVVTHDHVDADCENAGYDAYKAVFTNEAFAEQNINKVIEALGHNFTYNYVWDIESDTPTCVCTPTCSRCGEKDPINGVVAIKTINPTCTLKGKTIYTATFAAPLTTQVKEVEIAELGHSYTTNSVVWAKDLSTATLTTRCERCFNEITKTVNVTSATTTQPTCKVEGKKTYTADFGNGKVYTQVVTLDKLAHTFGTPTYQWTSDYLSNTATVKCSSCQETITETKEALVTIASIADCFTVGKTTYTVDFVNSLFETQVKEVTETINHIWSNPTYTWSDDNATCTASRICSLCTTEESEVSYAVKNEQLPTCGVAGSYKYTATFTNKVFVQQVKEGTYKPLEHNWVFNMSNTNTDEYARDYYNKVYLDDFVKITMTCSHCHAEEMRCAYYDDDEITKQPTCAEDGVIVIDYAFYLFNPDSEIEKYILETYGTTVQMEFKIHLDPSLHNIEDASDCMQKWDYNNPQLTLFATCNVCDRFISINVNAYCYDSSGYDCVLGEDYYWQSEEVPQAGGKVFTSTVHVNGTGSHDFEVTYNPENGYYQEGTYYAYCTLTINCKNCGVTQRNQDTFEGTKHIDTLQAPTCTDDGSVTLTFTFENTEHLYNDYVFNPYTVTYTISAIGHAPTSDGWIDATVTCTEAGVIAHYECDNCHKYFDADWNELTTIESPALGHIFENTVYTQSQDKETCTAVDTCTRCLQEISEIVSLTSYDTEEGTCKTKAYESWTYNFTKGFEPYVEKIEYDYGDHNFQGDAIVSWAKEGDDWYATAKATCSVCGEVSEKVKAIFDKSQEASCTQPGGNYYKATFTTFTEVGTSGVVSYFDELEPKLEHNYSCEFTYSLTSTTDTFLTDIESSTVTAKWICSVCRDVSEELVGTYSSIYINTSSTCSVKGNATVTYVFGFDDPPTFTPLVTYLDSICFVVTKDYDLPLDGDKHNLVPTESPAQLEKNWDFINEKITIVGDCLNCGKTLTVEKAISIYDRSEYDCIEGQDLYWIADFGGTPYGLTEYFTTQHVDGNGHNYGDLIPIVPATCANTGTKAHYECSECHKYFDADKKEIASITIPALGHDPYFSEYEEPTAEYPTMSLAVIKCSRCNLVDTIFGEVISDAVTTQPGCTTDGVRTITFAYPDVTTKYPSLTVENKAFDLAIPAKGHTITNQNYSYSEAEGSTPAKPKPLCTATASCSECGEEFSETVGGSPSNFELATCTSAGYIEFTFGWDTTVGAWENDFFEVQIKTYNLPILNHTPGTITYTWRLAEEGNTFGGAYCKGEFTCTECQNTITLELETIPGDIQPATCSADGFIEYLYIPQGSPYFTNQSKTYTLPQVEHTLSSLVPATDATCEEAGNIAYYECSSCHKYFNSDKQLVESVTIDALGHNYGSLITEVPASCESAGTKAHYECSRCHKLFIKEGDVYTEVSAQDLVITKLDHEFNDNSRANATYKWSIDYSKCTAKMTCINCSTSIEVETVDTTSTITEATCTEDGKTTYTAKFPKTDLPDQTKEVLIVSLGHIVGSLIPQQNPTCTEKGIKAHYVCEKCESWCILVDPDYVVKEKSYFDIAATGHDINHTIIPEVSATCDQPGTKAHYKCNNCDALFLYIENNYVEVTEEDLEIPALEHEYGELVTGHAATCTLPGEIDHYVCDRCNKLFNSNKELVEIISTSSLGHLFNDPTYVWDDTTHICTASRTCTRENCGFIETEDGHTTEYPGTAATCTGKGSTTYVATFINPAFETQTKQMEVPANGHTWNKPKITWSDDYTKCTVESVCSVCTTPVYEEVQSVVSSVIVATCTQAGSKTWEAVFTTQGIQKATIQQEIPVLGHLYENDNIKYEWNDDGSQCSATATCSRCTQSVGEIATIENGKITVTPVQAATCSQEGSNKHTATFTNTVFTTQNQNFTISALGHVYGELVTEVAATCNKTGKIAHYRCSACQKTFTKDGDVYTEVSAEDLVIPQLSHNFVSHNAVDPDCTTAGMKAYRQCSKCNVVQTLVSEEWVTASLDDLVIPALGHTTGDSFTYVNVEGTWYKRYVCEVCTENVDEEDTLVVCEVDNTPYHTLQEAVNAAIDGSTVKLLKNCSGATIVFPQDKEVIVDYNGFTYTIQGEEGQQTPKGASSEDIIDSLGFIISNGAKVTFKNGTILNTSDGNIEAAKILITNFGDLVIEDMTIDGSTTKNGYGLYVISNYNGSLKVKGNTVITADNNGVALDALYIQGKTTSIAIEFDSTAVVNGNIEVGSNNDKEDLGKIINVDITKLDVENISINTVGNFELSELLGLPEGYDDIYEGKLHKHTLQSHAAKSANCTEEGCVAYEECSVCKKVYITDQGKKVLVKKDTVIISKLGHNMYHIPGQAATCLSQGLMECYQCLRCTNYYLDEEGTTQVEDNNPFINALGHKYTKYTWTEATAKNPLKAGDYFVITNWNGTIAAGIEKVSGRKVSINTTTGQYDPSIIEIFKLETGTVSGHYFFRPLSTNGYMVATGTQGLFDEVDSYDGNVLNKYNFAITYNDNYTFVKADKSGLSYTILNFATGGWGISSGYGSYTKLFKLTLNDWVDTEEIPTLNGYYQCSHDCGYCWDRNDVCIAHGTDDHNIVETVNYLAPSCTEDGHNAYTYCDKCHQYLDSDGNVTTLEALTIEATGHNYGDLIEEVLPTTESEGLMAHYYCSLCETYFDEEKVETTFEELVIGKLTHTHSFTEHIDGQDATCKENGWLECYKCSNPTCTVIAPTLNGEAVALTLDDWKEGDGLLPHHTITHVEAIAVTCTKDGNYEYWYCESCNIIYKTETLDKSEVYDNLDATIIPASHNYGSNTDLTVRVSNTEQKIIKLCTVCNHYVDQNDGTEYTNKITYSYLRAKSGVKFFNGDKIIIANESGSYPGKKLAKYNGTYTASNNTNNSAEKVTDYSTECEFTLIEGTSDNAGKYRIAFSNNKEIKAATGGSMGTGMDSGYGGYWTLTVDSSNKAKIVSGSVYICPSYSNNTYTLVRSSSNLNTTGIYVKTATLTKA